MTSLSIGAFSSLTAERRPSSTLRSSAHGVRSPLRFQVCLCSSLSERFGSKFRKNALYMHWLKEPLKQFSVDFQA